MLTLHIDKNEFFDQKTRKFIDVPEMELELEHSLVSLSKWEEIWEIPFLNSDNKTNEQVHSYIKCMLLTKDVPDVVIQVITSEQYTLINEYISAKRTATTFSNVPNQRGTGEFVTAELIYYWLVALQIPFQPTETWHLSKLLTLVKVVNLKNTPPKKMSRSEVAARQRQLNAARRAQYGTKG